MEGKTKLGTLKARAIQSDEYPGITITLNRNGKELEFAWVEVDESEWNENPVLKIHVYNAVDDEPSFNLDQTEQDLNKYFCEE